MHCSMAPVRRGLERVSHPSCFTQNVFCVLSAGTTEPGGGRGKEITEAASVPARPVLGVGV